MIKLSDLAGFDLAKREDNDDTDLGDFSKLPLPRNIGVYESVKRRDGPVFKRLDNTTRSYSSAASISCAGKEGRKSSKENTFPAPDRIDGGFPEDSSARQRRNSFTFKARSSVELNKIDGHPLLNRNIKDNVKLGNRASIDGSNIPCSRIISQKTFDATSNHSTRPVSHDFPQTSFFYTTRNVLVHSQKTPQREKSQDSVTPLRETNTPYSVSQKFIDRKYRPASVKSLPDKMRERSLKSDAYNLNQRHSTFVSRKRDQSDYNLTLTYSTSTYPLHKKTTIV